MPVRVFARRPGLLIVCSALSTACAGDGPAGTPAQVWGGFAPAASFAAGGAGITSIATGELTGDGALDVLVVARTPSPTLRLLPGTGAGFGPAQVLQGLADPIRAAVADVTGDGRADVLAVGHFDNGMRLWPSAPGGLGAAVPHGLVNHGRNVFTGDWDGDGRADAAAVHDGSGQPVTLTAFRGGAGGLQRAWEHRSGSFASGGVCTGDLDGDGRMDVAIVTGDEAAPVLVYAGRGDATFQPPRALPPLGPAGAHDGAFDVACGDLDGDGRADLVTAHSAGSRSTGRNAVSVRRGAANTASYEVPVPEPRDLHLADLDRDGRVDAVLTHPEAARLTLLPGRGDGTFAAPVAVALDDPAGVVAVADVDGDGWPDLLVTGTDTVRLLRNQGRVPAP